MILGKATFVWDLTANFIMSTSPCLEKHKPTTLFLSRASVFLMSFVHLFLLKEIESITSYVFLTAVLFNLKIFVLIVFLIPFFVSIISL